MTPLTDENYKEILNAHFDAGEIAICGITPTPTCPQCQATQKSAEMFMTKHPNSNIRFCFVDYAKYNVLQNYYQIHEMNEYPKFVVFYGNWDDKDFFEGKLSVDMIERIAAKLPPKS
jgi:hypothetical protein